VSRYPYCIFYSWIENLFVIKSRHKTFVLPAVIRFVWNFLKSFGTYLNGSLFSTFPSCPNRFFYTKGFKIKGTGGSSLPGFRNDRHQNAVCSTVCLCFVSISVTLKLVEIMCFVPKYSIFRRWHEKTGVVIMAIDN